MRELAVYYCRTCGHYGYYQLSRNAVCQKCQSDMSPLNMRYQDFMNLDPEERDDLLSEIILSSAPSIVERVMAPHKKFNSRETIAALSRQIEDLEAKNQKLNETVDWMHKTIWELLKKNKELELPQGTPPDN